jgi:hypothetical protein
MKKCVVNSWSVIEFAGIGKNANNDAAPLMKLVDNLGMI